MVIIQKIEETKFKYEFTAMVSTYRFFNDLEKLFTLKIEQSIKYAYVFLLFDTG